MIRKFLRFKNPAIFGNGLSYVIFERTLNNPNSRKNMNNKKRKKKRKKTKKEKNGENQGRVIPRELFDHQQTILLKEHYTIHQINTI